MMIAKPESVKISDKRRKIHW